MCKKKCTFAAIFEKKTVMNIPNNPEMLLSFVNMKLRDEYQTLEDLCEDLAIDIDELCQKLHSAGYEYSPDAKRFM
jgi:hypothetical protein